MTILLTVAYLLLCLAVPCLSCGGLVHGELAQRSKLLFSLQHDAKNTTSEEKYRSQVSRWLQKYDGSILAGSFMPDWGYGCSGGDDLSEAMHWPPFLKAAVEHIREKYPNPENNEKAQALVAFIFAVAGHQVQDAAWHSIGLLMGIMDEVAKVDCHDDFAAAHMALDWGGDAIFGKRFSGIKGASDWAFGDWYVPVDDLQAIYKRLNMSMSTWQMKYCIVRLRGVLLAAAKGASLFFGKYSQVSPFMLDYFDHYYLGGVDDMTSTTVECWTNLLEWVRTGEIGEPWNLCPLTAAITRRTNAVPCIFDLVRQDLKTETDEIILKDLHAEDKDGVFRVWYDGPRNSEPLGRDPDDGRSPSHQLSNIYPYSRFGHSMALVEFGLRDGLQLAISSPFETHPSYPPYTGAVRLVSLSEDSVTPTTILHPSRSTFKMSGLRFGFSMASFKLQNKNMSAVAVGIPGWDPAGAVDIYTGSATNHLFDIKPQLTISPWNSVWFRSQYGKRAFGSKLFVADVDGDGKDDLLIASPWSDFTESPTLPDPPETLVTPSPKPSRPHLDPQHGGIVIFTGVQLEFMVGVEEVFDEDCAYQISPPSLTGFERFGTSIGFAKKAGVLLVGEPGAARNRSVCGRGRVYGIKVTHKLRSIVFTIDGPVVDEESLGTEFGGGGLASGVTNDGTEWFAVAAHNADYEGLRQAGLVEVYTLREKFNKTSKTSMYLTEKVLTIRAEEPQQFGKFGSVATSDEKDILWISSGWANEEDGAVWRYNITLGILLARQARDEGLLENGIQHVFESQDTCFPAELFAKGNEPKARFGDSMLMGDFNGDGVRDLIVGSPFSNGKDQSVTLSGKVEVFFLGKSV